MVRTTKINFHVYDKRSGGQFTTFTVYYNPMHAYDLNKFVEMQASEIENLGYGVLNVDYETRITEADIAAAFESSQQFCPEPGFNKVPDMPKWGVNPQQ